MSILGAIGTLRRMTYAPSKQLLSLHFGKSIIIPIEGVSQKHWDELRAIKGAMNWIQYVETYLQCPEWMAAVSAPERRSLPLFGKDATMVAESLARINDFLPTNEARAYVTDLLTWFTPCLVFPVRYRVTKHGDHMGRQGAISRITVNVCGNPYQFLLTLLHEIAHAEVTSRFGAIAAPHGFQWRLAYQRLLREAMQQQAFPCKIHAALEKHAADPPASSSRDIQMQVALKEFNFHDKRPMVRELAEGVWFSLDGQLKLRRGSALRSRIECRDISGNRYRVSAIARVHTLYHPQ